MLCFLGNAQSHLRSEVYDACVIAEKEAKSTCGAVAERLRRRSREQNVPGSIPRLGISVEVTSRNANFHGLYTVRTPLSGIRKGDKKNVPLSGGPT